MSLLGGGSANKPSPPSAALRVQTSIAGKCKPIFVGQMRTTGNLIWYGNFESTPASGGGKSGGKGGGGGGKGGKGASGSYDYSAYMAVALGEGPINNVLQVWSGSTSESLANVNLNVFGGGYDQGTWSFMDSVHPGESLNYRGTAYLGASPFELGGSPALPNLNYEVLANIANAIAGQPDADPSVFIADYLSNPHYGVGFPSAMLGNLALYQAMCLAAGLIISDALVSQTAASSYLAALLDATNSEFVWSSGLLTIVPYGDVGAISANGYAYTPPMTPLFSLGDDDFMKNSGSSTIGVSAYTSDDPVICVRKRRSDALNDVKVEYLDRGSVYTDPDTGDIVSNAYNPTIVEVMDEAAIETWGLRPASTKTMHFFALASAATIAANCQLRRQLVLNQFTFTLDQRYIVLDPMDLVEITDASLGLFNQPVLITEITENDDSSLTFVAEEWLGAASAFPAHGLQASAGYVPNYNVSPPTTNPPILFAAPPQIATNGGLEIWLAASGATGWGGCDIWLSGDGTTYLNVGRMMGPCRQGVLSAAFGIAADPDTSGTLAVNLAESAGSLQSGTSTDADNANTLCYCDGELISYSTATLTGQYQYSLVSYIRRGQYGTAIASHAAGSAFARLDSQIFRYAYSVDQIGKPLYVKLTAFNVYGGGEEELSAVTATEMTIPAPPPPSNVTGFGVTEQNNIVSFSWNPVADFALRGYDIGYAPQGTTLWADFEMLTEASGGTEMTNAEVPPGTWVFGIRARDIANQLSPEIATANLTVVAQDIVIAEIEQSPGWPGTLSGFVLHYTGVLVPDDQHTLGSYLATGWTVFENGFQPTPVTTASYTAPVIDQGYDDNNEVSATHTTNLLPGQSGAATIALSIDTWLTGATDPSTFTSWSDGYLTLRYLVMRLTMTGIVAGAVSNLSQFEPVIDTGAPPVQYDQQVTAGAGGSTITFAKPFHVAPTISLSVISSGPLYASVSEITATTCVVNIWNPAGTSVGGAVNLSLKGE